MQCTGALESFGRKRRSASENRTEAGLEQPLLITITTPMTSTPSISGNVLSFGNKDWSIFPKMSRKGPLWAFPDFFPLQSASSFQTLRRIQGSLVKLRAWSSEWDLVEFCQSMSILASVSQWAKECSKNRFCKAPMAMVTFRRWVHKQSHRRMLTFLLSRDFQVHEQLDKENPAKIVEKG